MQQPKIPSRSTPTKAVLKQSPTDTRHITCPGQASTRNPPKPKSLPRSPTFTHFFYQRIQNPRKFSLMHYHIPENYPIFAMHPPKLGTAATGPDASKSTEIDDYEGDGQKVFHKRWEIVAGSGRVS